MMERLLGKKVLYLLPGAKTMLKILVIDRCHFTRTGMEACLITLMCSVLHCWYPG